MGFNKESREGWIGVWRWGGEFGRGKNEQRDKELKEFKKGGGF